MSELLEKILSNINIDNAYKRVCANKGAGGVDGVTVEELGDYINKNWNSIREQIRKRTYKPQPVKRVEIPKPNGGVRNLGIPTVMDRVIQQGIVQVISPMCEPLFSDWSYGFRLDRSCEMAIRQLLICNSSADPWHSLNLSIHVSAFSPFAHPSLRSGSFYSVDPPQLMEKG